MKKKQLAVVLTATLIAMCTGACGTQDPAPSGQETADTAPSTPDSEAGTEEETADQSGGTAADAEETEEPDTSVTDVETGESGETAAVSHVSVTFQESSDEVKADDGTLVLTRDTSMPVVSIEGAPDVAEKINADIEAYYASSTSDDDNAAELAKSDYEASSADENGGWFPSYGYSESLTAKVTRMDDAVLSLELTFYSYTGGAHGNYGSIGKNYDTRTGELISLEDLSEDYAAFHATALDYIVNLAESPAYQERLFEPTKNDLDSALFADGSWIFTQSGLSFMSDPYVLGPYASGEIYFRLPYEKAYDIGLKEDYRYDGNFMEERYYIYQYDTETQTPIVDGTPDYSFDLNGDGTAEGLAFYGTVQSTENDSTKYAYYIDGTDWGEVIGEQLEASDNGYLDTTYALYDSDPSDGLTEIAILFTEFYDDGSDSGLTGTNEYTYLFQYTADKQLQFLEKRDGLITNQFSS